MSSRLIRNCIPRQILTSTVIKILLFILVTFVIIYQIKGNKTLYLEWKHDNLYQEYGERIVNTNKGWVSYNDIEKNIYKPLNYEIQNYTVPIPTLRRTDNQTCGQIYGNWLRIIEASEFSGPHQRIPKHLLNQYMLNGYVRRADYFRNDMHPPSERIWDNIDDWSSYTEKQYAHISNYGQTGLAVHYALKYYPVTGLSGAVFGSLTPWVEGMAIQAGAKEILTVEYLKLKIENNDIIKYAHPLDFAKNFESYLDKFDFVISFSSLEHSGLGRYGDVLDPIGDLREIQKIHCSLRPGGIFYLGLPRGQDILNYNVHRIYGRIRLAMVMTGFEWLDTFRGSSRHPVTVKLHDLDAHQSATGAEQDLFILRKL